MTVLLLLKYFIERYEFSNDNFLHQPQCSIQYASYLVLLRSTSNYGRPTSFDQDQINVYDSSVASTIAHYRPSPRTKLHYLRY